MYDVHEEISGDTAGSSTEEVNDMGKFSIVEYNINIFLLKIPTKINNCKMQWYFKRTLEGTVA